MLLQNLGIVPLLNNKIAAEYETELHFLALLKVYAAHPEFHPFRTMREEEVPATSEPELSFIYCLLNADSNKAPHQ